MDLHNYSSDTKDEPGTYTTGMAPSSLFESHWGWGYRCLFVVSVACCQVEASATS